MNWHIGSTKQIPFLEGPEGAKSLRFGPREGLECCQEDAPKAPMRRCFNVKSRLEVRWHLQKRAPKRHLEIWKKKKKGKKTSLYKRINEKGTLESFLRIHHQNGDSNLWKMLLQKSPVGSYPSTPPSNINGLYIPTFAVRIGARWRTNFWTFRKKLLKPTFTSFTNQLQPTSFSLIST